MNGLEMHKLYGVLAQLIERRSVSDRRSLV